MSLISKVQVTILRAKSYLKQDKWTGWLIKENQLILLFMLLLLSVHLFVCVRGRDPCEMRVLWDVCKETCLERFRDTLNKCWVAVYLLFYPVFHRTTVCLFNSDFYGKIHYTSFGVKKHIYSIAKFFHGSSLAKCPCGSWEFRKQDTIAESQGRC